MQVREVLTRSKSLLEQQGWNQGSLTDGHGAYCLKGAVGVASGVFHDIDGAVYMMQIGQNADWRERRDYMDKLKVESAALKLLGEFLPQPYESIPQWNDARSTTKDDVLAVLDKAISACTDVGFAG